ncbi:M14 family zinc carboxypeptidase [Nonomuraea sp. NPDC050404]|uniref:M14 family zinc carboxypeptidase n=1 Tax=Nonomuraea sp. NPDC050404 TaxID=3155783 RepID=UPI0033C29A3C
MSQESRSRGRRVLAASAVLAAVVGGYMTVGPAVADLCDTEALLLCEEDAGTDQALPDLIPEEQDDEPEPIKDEEPVDDGSERPLPEESAPEDTASVPAADEETPDPDLKTEYFVYGPTSRADVGRVTAAGATITGGDLGYLTVMATATQAEQLADLGFGVRSRAVPDEVEPGHATYESLMAQVNNLVRTYPNLVRKQLIGKSHEKRNLIAVKITGDVAKSDVAKSDVAKSDVAKSRPKPEVLFVHHQHAREVVTLDMARYLLDLFTRNYCKGGRCTDEQKTITRLLDTRVVWIVPDLNPDGGVWDRSGMLDGKPVYRESRKNRQPNTGARSTLNPSDDPVGTDLNRNWGYQWNTTGSDIRKESETYRGPAAFSAPETRAARDFVARRNKDRQRITMAVDWHSFLSAVLSPYGYTKNERDGQMTLDQRQVFDRLGQQLADRYSAGKVSYRRASSLVPEGSPPPAGGMIDWLWGNQKIFAFALEMGAGKSGVVKEHNPFYPPASMIEDITAENKAAVLHLLEQADCPYRVIGKERSFC